MLSRIGNVIHCRIRRTKNYANANLVKKARQNSKHFSIERGFINGWRKRLIVSYQQQRFKLFFLIARIFCAPILKTGYDDAANGGYDAGSLKFRDLVLQKDNGHRDGHHR